MRDARRDSERFGAAHDARASGSSLRVGVPAPSEPPTSVRRRKDDDTPTEPRLAPAIPLFESVPLLTLELSEMTNVPLDPRSAFFLSRIDGMSTVATLFDVCGMAEEESLNILNDLLELGIVILR